MRRACPIVPGMANRMRSGFPALVKRTGWRVCQLRDMTGADYTTAADWAKGRREMKLAHAATLQAEADKLGIETKVADFMPPKRKAA